MTTEALELAQCEGLWHPILLQNFFTSVIFIRRRQNYKGMPTTALWLNPALAAQLQLPVAMPNALPFAAFIALPNKCMPMPTSGMRSWPRSSSGILETH